MSTLMVEIRDRAGARAMSLADLARAAKMQPGNLRRMLTSPTANPRLDTVMRLLGPLQAALGPAGARTAAQVVEHLDAERLRRGASWRELIADGGRGGATIVRRLKSDPGALTLEIVMRIVGGLEIELSVVDAAGDSGPEVAGSSKEKRDAHRGGRPRRQGVAAVDPRGGDGAGEETLLQEDAPGARRPAAATMFEAAEPDDPPPPPPPPPAAAPGWPPPLRPPRLGRYRDAPDRPTRPRAPATATTSTTSPSSAPAYELELTLLDNLADITAAGWRKVYLGLASLIHGSEVAPTETLDHLADGTAKLLGRGRRPRRPPAPEPELPLTMVDPEPLLVAWRRSAKPEEQLSGAVDAVDASGPLALHLSLHQEHWLAVRPARGGRPAELARIVHMGPPKTWREVDVPLAVRVAGELHSFTHVRAGPVLGELGLSGFGYLIAGISASLTIIEVAPTGSRAVWFGPAEELSAVDLEPPLGLVPGGTPAAETAAAPRSAPEHGDTAESVASPTPTPSSEDANASATVAARPDEPGAPVAIAAAFAFVIDLLEKATTAAVVFWQARNELAAELAQVRADQEGDPERIHQRLAEERATHAQAREEAAELGRRVTGLEDEIVEIRAAARDRSAVLEEENARLVDALGEAEARLKAVSEVRAAIEARLVVADGARPEVTAMAKALAESRARAEAEAKAREELEKEVSAMRQQITAARDGQAGREIQVADLIRKRDEARAALEIQGERLVELRAALDERTRGLSRIEAAQVAPTQERDEARRELEIQTRRLAEVRAGVEADRAELLRERDEAREEARRLSEADPGSEATIAELTRERDEAQERARRLAEVDADRGATIAELTRERDEAREALEAQIRRYEEAEADLASARAELDSAQNELRSEITEVNARLDRLRRQYGEDQRAKPTTFAQKWRKKKPPR